MLLALVADLLQLPLEVLQAAADAPPLHLDLLLTRAAPGSDAADLPVVVVRADQPRQQVVELGRLDLQPALPSARVLGEDVEDQLRAVDHAQPQLALEVPLLAGAQVLVADQDVVADLVLGLPQLFDLALADEQGRLDLGPALDVRGDDFGPGRPAQLRQLRHLLGQRRLRGPWELHADQVGALLGRLRGDQSLSRRSLSIASSRRSSGAVTESRNQPSPWGPKPTPGVMLTPAWSRIRDAKPIESWPSGTGAHT